MQNNAYDAMRFHRFVVWYTKNCAALATISISQAFCNNNIVATVTYEKRNRFGDKHNVRTR